MPFSKLTRETRTKIGQAAVLIIFVLLFRIVYIDIYEALQVSSGFSFMAYAVLFITDYWALFTSLTLDIIFLWLLHKYIPYGQSPFHRLILYLSGILANSVIGTVIVNHAMLFGTLSSVEDGRKLLASYITIVLINTLVVATTDVILFFRQSRREMRMEGEKTRKAQYQYQQLKQQLNPHFLFNSLNILDYLVQNDEKQRASDYIKKLAGVYRYLLNMGKNKLVPLSEELHFISLYVDLLKERFTDGLHLTIDIDPEAIHRQIIPCGLQILVENATKHNIISKDHPLFIRIYIDKAADTIVVNNNLQLRLNVPSTGVGLTNIQKQYLDIANKAIIVQSNNTEFTVRLPLL